jgi:hypothetical protein
MLVDAKTRATGPMTSLTASRAINRSRLLVEAFRWLVPLPVFKTGVARDPGQAGSIPVRLRQQLEI